MQENRSFDEYFGTYPGADGLPRRNGRFTVCVPDTYRHRCVKPYHETSPRNLGGPHEHLDAVRDVNGGKLNGFITQARRGREGRLPEPTHDPACGGSLRTRAGRDGLPSMPARDPQLLGLR